MLPEAYELLEEDPEADSTPGRLEPQPTNEELVDKAKASDEVSLIKNSAEFCSYRDQKLDLEAKSPIKLLRSQRHGGPHGGFYHDNCRNDPVVAFKLWHMCYRTQNADFPAQHLYEKYRANETQVFQRMAKMDPVYMGRKSKNDIVFRAGDLRSTYDEDLKSSDAGPRVELAHKKLYEKLLSEGGAREQLQNAMLQYVLACKITAEEAGDLILEDEKAHHQGNVDIMQDGPPVYTSKEALSILTVNLGNFIRGRKKSAPAKYAQFVDRKDSSGVGPLVKSLARSKSHIIRLLEASNLDIEEVAYLVRHGWYMQSNKGRDICIMTRTNMSSEYEHLAGPVAQPDVHQHLPLSYWVVEIRYGKAPTPAAIRKTGSNLQDRFSRNYMEDDLERCGMQVFRVCAFHMSAKIASKKRALTREAMGIMLADCFHYQADYITGDANMAGYRTGGSKQGSTSIRDSCFQEMVRYYLKAYNAAQSGDPYYCCPKAKFCTSNPLTLLRWVEDKFGILWKNVGAIDWQSIPSMDCMAACILEWAHTIPMERWSQATDPTDEYKVRISEWLLHSSRDVYMLPDYSDSDSHTPLLVHLTPSWMSNKEKRELRNPETLKASHDSRRAKDKHYSKGKRQK